MDDYGNYTAKVTNQAGSSFFHYEIARPLPPDMPTNLKVVAQGKTSLSVWFTAGFDGGAPQTFTIEYKVEGKEPKLLKGIKEDGKTKTITHDITGLLNGVVYYIRVKSVNDIGSSNYTKAIKKKTGTGSSTNGKVSIMPVWQLVVIVVSAVFVVVAVTILAIYLKKRNKCDHAGAGRETDYAIPGPRPAPIESDYDQIVLESRVDAAITGAGNEGFEYEQIKDQNPPRGAETSYSLYENLQDDGDTGSPRDVTYENVPSVRRN